jgi:hypothetical protein
MLIGWHLLLPFQPPDLFEHWLLIPVVLVTWSGVFANLPAEEIPRHREDLICQVQCNNVSVTTFIMDT